MVEYGFAQSKNDYSLYTFSKGNVFIILLVYVDDIILTGNSETKIKKVKDFLSSKFRIKDLGLLQFFLGIEIIKINKGLCLCQRKYTLELLHEYGLVGCNSVATPFDQITTISNKGTDENDSLLTDFTGTRNLLEN